MATSTVSGPDALAVMRVSLTGDWSGRMELDLDGGRVGATHVTSSTRGSMEMMGQRLTLTSRVSMDQTPIG